MSASANGGSTGSRSGNPVRAAKPLMASTRVPKPGSGAYGPVCPNPEMRTMTRLELTLIVLSQKVAGVSPVESDYGGDSRISMLEAEMDLRGAGDSESRFAAYFEGLAGGVGHGDRAQPRRDY